MLELDRDYPAPTAIGEVLKVMAWEMAALEQCRKEPRALKMATEQELLTGRARLI